MAGQVLLRSARGAILIQAALASLVLFGFGAFVFDYGLFWVSRAQAQGAADAAALAGALARAYDDFSDPPADGGIVPQSALSVAQKHQIWTETPPAAAVVVTYTCPGDINTGGGCVRVDVHRDVESGNPLPTVFGPIWGITSQSIKATATAQVKIGDTTNCLRPWAIPDEWQVLRPVSGPWTAASTFDRYLAGGPTGTLLASPPSAWDVYTPPSSSSTGTGLTVDSDPAATLAFNPIDPGSPFTITAWQIQPLQLPGAKTYAENIAGCNGQPIAIGQQVPIDLAANTNETTDGWNVLIAEDPAATWNASDRRIDSSCAPGCARLSPRLVAVVLYDVDLFGKMAAVPDWSGCSTANPCVQIANIAGFFIDHVDGPGVVSGYLTSYPGLSAAGNAPPVLETASSFLKAIQLVR